MSRESASDVFFHTEVSGDEHEVSTEFEFSPNTLKLMFDAGKNYFVRQYIKVGAFVGGADLELIPEAQGKEAVAKLAWPHQAPAAASSEMRMTDRLVSRRVHQRPEQDVRHGLMASKATQ
jgi:hypothetical protein